MSVGFQLCIKAMKGQQEDRLYQRWLAEKSNLKEEYRHNYEAYKRLFKPTRALTDSERAKIKARIDRQTERVLAKLTQKG